MESKISLETLIEESRNGNSLSFKEIYDHLVDRLFLYVRSRSKSREDAIDITQEVFVDFWQSLNKFEYVSEPKLYGFLYTIAFRRISKHYRFKRPQVSLEDVGDVFVAENNTVEITEAKRAAEALKHLNNSDRDVIILRYFSGLTFIEIAEILSQNENAIKVRHHRAIQKLQRILQYKK